LNVRVSGRKYLRDLLSPEMVRELFDYNSLTGEVTCKYIESDSVMLANLFGRGGLASRNSTKAGMPITTKRKNKAGNIYIDARIGLKGLTYSCSGHELAWVVHFGIWPTEIDHIDGDGLNNKLTNLREVTRLENNKNHRRQSNNTSGVSGVSWMPGASKWRAFHYESTPTRKQKSLGQFKDFFEACCARKAYEYIKGYTERHGL